MGSAQTGVLHGTGEKLCGWPESNGRYCGQWGGWLENIRDSVDGYSDINSQGNSISTLILI